MQNPPFPAPGVEHCDGMTVLCIIVALRAIRDRNYDEFYREIARVELAQEISEFQALCLQAILEVTQGSAFADESIGMAEVVASTTNERALARECRAAYEGLQLHPLSVSACRQAAMEHSEYVDLNPGLLIEICVASSEADTANSLANTHAA